MTTIEKMDLALDTVYKYKHKRITIHMFINEIIYPNNPLTIVDIGGCIDILKQDGYIREIVDEDLKEKYLKQFSDDECRNHYRFLVITMQGMLFKENGGYTIQQKKERSKLRRTNIHNWTVGMGAVFGGAYGLFQILQWMFHIPNEADWNVVHVSLFLLIFLLGSIAGLIVALLLVELRHKRTNT